MTHRSVLDARLVDTLESAQLRARLRQEIEARVRAQGGLTLTRPRVQIPASPGVTTAPSTPTAKASPAQQTEIVEGVLRQLLVLVGKGPGAWADRRISPQEAGALGTLLITSVSTAVTQAAPLVQDAEARDLVLLIYGVLFDQFIRPMLPGWLQLFAGAIRDQAPRLLEDIYWTLVWRGKPMSHLPGQ